MSSTPWIIAHRGASGHYPENSLISFLGAVELGATCVEMDIQPTSDKQLVLFHDRTLERICGITQMIPEMTLNEVRQLDVGLWKDSKWEGTRIPQLVDVLDKLPRSMNLNLELKYHSSHDSWFERSVIDIAMEYDLPKRGYIAIKHVDKIPLLKNIAPECPLGLLQKQRTPQESLDLCCKFDLPIVQIRKSAISNEWIEKFQDNGIKVNYFFSDNSNEMVTLFKNYNLDGILTNYPDRGVKALQQLNLI